MDLQTKSSTVADTIATLKNIPTMEDLRNVLGQNVLVIDFTKLNGDKRVMTCTLREDMKPAEVVKEGAPKKVSDTNISVWDLNAQGWRSFRYDRINSVDYVDEYREEWLTSNKQCAIINSKLKKGNGETK